MSEEWSGVMEAHAKSFHLAALLFPRDVARRVRALYALCRWIDDAVDEAPDSVEAERRLSLIRDDLASDASEMEVNRLYKADGLHPGYMEDLIQGAAFDLQTVRIETQDELIQYCYKVAGTVGLAMADLMGVKDPKARAFAVDLGIGMQITNICRDVKEDAEQGRVYLPAELLQRCGTSSEALLDGSADRAAVSRATKELLTLADRYYFSARHAFPSIPWRARGAIHVAAALYRGIGVKLLRNGADPLVGRTMLTLPEKLAGVAKGIARWLTPNFAGPALNHESVLHRGLGEWQTLRGFGS